MCENFSFPTSSPALIFILFLNIILKDSCTECRFLGWQVFFLSFFFFLSALWKKSHPTTFWPKWFLMRNQLYNLLRICYMWCYFSHAAFKILCLLLFTIWLWCFYVWMSFYFFGVHFASCMSRFMFSSYLRCFRPSFFFSFKTQFF